MKRYLIAGNWKMNFVSNEAVSFVQALKSKLTNLQLNNIEILLCVPFTNLHPIKQFTDRETFSIGAQNMHYELKGAFTGEVSAPMLVDAGCEYVILGHSERRQYFNEDNELLTKKLITALNNNLKPILCIGETIGERQSGDTFKVLEFQLQVLNHIDQDKLANITLAYEPVWAIGTGLNATSEQISEAHQWIDNFIFDLFNVNLRILYGGSMNDANAKEILECKKVSGGLIGGASLKIEQFTNIIRTAIDISQNG